MRHTVGLYHGQIGSKEWKRYLSDNMMARDSDFQKTKHIMTIAQNNEKANIEKNNTSAGVFKLTAKKVPKKTPIKIKIPKDFTILKSTASCSLCVRVDIIEVGIIIAKDVPTARCILVTMSKSKTVNA